MSPEQCLGEPLDRRSDVFAVGILLFELITGRRLFKRDTELLTMRAITEEAIPDPVQYRANLPAELGVIVRRALQRDREQRHASAQELREALERFIADFGVPATSLELSNLLEDLFPDHVERQSKVREAGSLSEVIAALPSTGTGIKDLGTPSSQQSAGALGSGSAVAPQAPGSKLPIVLALLGISALIAVAAVAMLLMRAPPAGELVITTSPPGAEVRLDGARLGLSPMAREDLELDHPYLLQVSASGYALHEEHLILTRARPSQELRLALEALPEPNVGEIEVITEPPGAQVSLDGKAAGISPLRLEEVTADLEHRVAVSLDGYQSETRMVLLRAGATQTISLTLAKKSARPTHRPRPRPAERPKPKPGEEPVLPPTESAGTGFLSLRTTPWTRVYHGAVELGDTPLFKVELPAGKVKLRLLNPDKGIDRSLQVTIKKGEVTTLNKKF
jgi:hypothetical protein